MALQQPLPSLRPVFVICSTRLLLSERIRLLALLPGLRPVFVVCSTRCGEEPGNESNPTDIVTKGNHREVTTFVTNSCHPRAQAHARTHTHTHTHTHTYMYIHVHSSTNDSKYEKATYSQSYSSNQQTSLDSLPGF